jgi:hypothetical protein
MFSIERAFFIRSSLELSLRRASKPLDWFSSDPIGYARRASLLE